MNTVDRVSLTWLLVQEQMRTMETGLVRVVCSTEVV